MGIFRRYLETREDTESLRDVLTVLASGRNISVTVDDVVAHLPAGTKRDTVDDKIKRAMEKGFAIPVEPPSYTSSASRTFYRYSFSVADNRSNWLPDPSWKALENH